jgi:hypothetical protein
MEKICNVCKETKLLSEYYFRNGKPTYYCKSCHKTISKEYRSKNKEKIYKKVKEWNANNPDKRKAIKQKWVDKNPTYHKEYRDKFYKENPTYNKDYYWKNPELRREKSKEFRKNNPKHNQEYVKKRLKNDVNFRLAFNMRHRIIYAIKYSKTKKHTKTTDLLGCSVTELKSYLESKFLPTMTWENYGKLWHVDHILPCSKFDLTDKDQQKICFHYTNLQPLFATTTTINGMEYLGNINKGNKKIENYERAIKP